MPKQFLNDLSVVRHLSVGGDISGGNATTSKQGLMSSTDKSKLDGIANSANNYSLETHSASHHSDINQALLTTSTVQFGSIGINTSSPNFDIDVAGDIRIREENSLHFGGTGATDNKAEMKYNATTESIDFIFN